MKCGCQRDPGEKSALEKKMEAKVKANAAAVSALLDQMNSITGDRKVEAIATLPNKILQERNAMHEKMGQEKKPAGEAAKPGEQDHKADGAPAKPDEHQH
jgi:hypothetical protein